MLEACQSIKLIMCLLNDYSHTKVITWVPVKIKGACIIYGREGIGGGGGQKFCDLFSWGS